MIPVLFILMLVHFVHPQSYSDSTIFDITIKVGKCQRFWKDTSWFGTTMDPKIKFNSAGKPICLQKFADKEYPLFGLTCKFAGVKANDDIRLALWDENSGADDIKVNKTFNIKKFLFNELMADDYLMECIDNEWLVANKVCAKGFVDFRFDIIGASSGVLRTFVEVKVK